MNNYLIIEGNKHLRARIYKHSASNFMYSNNSKRDDKIYLRCQKNNTRTAFCPGTAVLDLQADELREGKQHNHQPDDYELELDLKKEVKRACGTNLTNARKSDIFRNVVRGHPDANKITFR